MSYGVLTRRSADLRQDRFLSQVRRTFASEEDSSCVAVPSIVAVDLTRNCACELTISRRETGSRASQTCKRTAIAARITIERAGEQTGQRSVPVQGAKRSRFKPVPAVYESSC